jgi:hypothetical protein
MKASLRKLKESVRWMALVFGATGCWLGIHSCSTTTTLSPLAPPKEVALPTYAYLPHPRGYTVNDIHLLFTDPSAPPREVLAKCEEDFRALYAKAQSIDERARGVRELVSRNPASLHWCFYSRILNLDEGLGHDDFVDEKQKRVLSEYEFLVPVARAFMQEFQDSRYMRWAIRDYRRLADLFFYRRLEMSPQMSQDLVEVEVPVDTYSERAREEARREAVLGKYKIGNAVPDSAVLPKEEGIAKTEGPNVNAASELPPPPVPGTAPVQAPVASSKQSDDSVQSTLDYAKELARERKDSERGARAPAAIPQPPTPVTNDPPAPDGIPIFE